MEETIVAISTPPGEGGIGVIRLSGSQAIPIAQHIFRSKISLGQRVRYAEYGSIYVEGRGIDTGLALVFSLHPIHILEKIPLRLAATGAGSFLKWL